MESPDAPSERVVEQRLWNRVLESLELLSTGDRGVRLVGANEYVNQFFDRIDDDIPTHWREWSVFTPEEVEQIDEVRQILLAARAATPQTLEDEDFIASGWPTRIQQTAHPALVLMQRRGRFDEDIEE